MPMNTTHDARTVQELRDLYKRNRLNLSPAFQRQSVWTTTDRRLLIQSLLDGMPLPSIYLYKQVGRNGTPLYDVIDGKQRLETILLFLDEGPLFATEDYLDVRTTFSADEDLDSWYWADLPRKTKHEFLSAQIPTIEVEGELPEIIRLFVRINSTGKPLTPQERRHAHFYTSPILKTAQLLADQYERALLKNGVITPGQMQRMKHVELVTELLLAVHAGQPLNKKTKIDEVIRGNSLSAGDLAKAKANLKHALNVGMRILPNLKTTRFRQLADFYTLTLLLHRLRSEGVGITAHDSHKNALAGSLLTEFGRRVDEVNEKNRKHKNIGRSEEHFRAYLMTTREGTDSAQNRKTREQLLRKVLDGIFDEVDPVRSFNPTQRRIIWHSSASKKCSFSDCRQPIVKWEDFAVDHRKAHVLGGKTDLSNAALAHRWCNARAGAHQ